MTLEHPATLPTDRSRHRTAQAHHSLNPHFPDGPSPIGTGFAHDPCKSGISCQFLLF